MRLPWSSVTSIIHLRMYYLAIRLRHNVICIAVIYSNTIIVTMHCMRDATQIKVCLSLDSHLCGFRVFAGTAAH